MLPSSLLPIIVNLDDVVCSLKRRGVKQSTNKYINTELNKHAFRASTNLRYNPMLKEYPEI
jgi:hypothetical protein